MQTPSKLKNVSRTAILPSILVLLLAILSGNLQTNRGGIWLFAWLTPVLWLLVSRVFFLRRKWLWFYLALIVSYVLGSYGKAPFPLPVLMVIGAIDGLKSLVIYILDRKIGYRFRGFWTTLFFPAAFVAKEYLDSISGGGVWGSMANTQYNFTWFIQLASVTGIWGLTFLITWLASILVRTWERRRAGLTANLGIKIYGLVMILVLGFGAWHIHTITSKTSDTVRIGGATVPLFSLLETIYKDDQGESIHIDPKISQSSPQLQKVNLSLAAFIKNAKESKYRNSARTIENIHDSLFVLTRKLARKGARIVSWSEANALVFKSDEQALIRKGQEVSAREGIYLLMGIASIDPAKLAPGSNFIENKAVFIGPDGSLLGTFYKNKPVPMVERTVPGDGNIPVIDTRYGSVALSICYDADFPSLMRQLGTKKAGLLLLPSGDWYAISPYHSEMAVFRGIENGVSIFRQVSGGLSIATDSRGKQLGTLDFYKKGEKSWIADVPVANHPTLYSILGDWLAWCSLLFVCVVTGIWTRSVFRKRKRRKASATAQEVNA